MKKISNIGIDHRELVDFATGSARIALTPNDFDKKQWFVCNMEHPPEIPASVLQSITEKIDNVIVTTVNSPSQQLKMFDTPLIEPILHGEINLTISIPKRRKFNPNNTPLNFKNYIHSLNKE